MTDHHRTLQLTDTSLSLNATFVRRSGSRRDPIPVLAMTSDLVPSHLDALIATSDLQARCESPEKNSSEGELAGVCIARALRETLPNTLGIRPDRCGVLLAGDFWSHPLGVDKRGGYGDVRPVIDAFTDLFCSVLCVPGNHDIYEERAGRNPACRS